LSQARAKAKARSAQEQYSAGLGDGVTLEMVEALESKARQAASEAAAAAATTQLQEEEAEALTNAAKLARLAAKEAIAAIATAAAVEYVPFESLCAAMRRLGLPLHETEGLAVALDAAPLVERGRVVHPALVVSRSAWMAAMREEEGQAPPVVEAERSVDSSSTADEEQEPEPEEDQAPAGMLASYSSWRAGGELIVPPPAPPPARPLGEAAAAAAAAATGPVRCWTDAMAAVERASIPRGVEHRDSYQTWHASATTRDAVAAAEKQQRAGAVEEGCGKEADARGGYSGWKSRMGEVFGGPAHRRAAGGMSEYEEQMERMFPGRQPAAAEEDGGEGGGWIHPGALLERQAG